MAGQGTIVTELLQQLPAPRPHRGVDRGRRLDLGHSLRHAALLTGDPRSSKSYRAIFPTS
jgi:hypothetical protein